MSGCAQALCEHISPSSPSPSNHLGALVGLIAAAAAVGGPDADAMGLAAAAAVVGDKRGRDPCASQQTVFVHLSQLIDLSTRTPE